MGMDAAYILPSPTQILVRMWELRGPLLTAHLPATLLCTGIGLAISIVLGLLLAVLMDASPAAEKMLYPLIVASQTIPTTALAPLFVLWFGYTIWSKVLVTVLITFSSRSPSRCLTASARPKPIWWDMLKTFGAGKKEVFLKLKLPAALPYFSRPSKWRSPQVPSSGAAIGEWLGAQAGLGYFSRRMMTQLDGAGVFAPIVAAECGGHARGRDRVVGLRKKSSPGAAACKDTKNHKTKFPPARLRRGADLLQPIERNGIYEKESFRRFCGLCHAAHRLLCRPERGQQHHPIPRRHSLTASCAS